MAPPVKEPGAGADRVALFGHDRVLGAVKLALASGRGAQAYLFCGPPSVGKSTAALHLAQWLLCGGPDDARPCGACRACRLVRSEAHPDLIVLEAPLKVDAVRGLQSRLSLAPMESRRHVAVLPAVDRSSLGAANSLLKTLEEPPTAAVLLLTAADAATVLPTIRSRCQLVRTPPLPREAAASALVAGWDVPADAADTLARLSGGRIGWAVRALEDPTALSRYNASLDQLESALGQGAAQRLASADSWARDAEGLAEALPAWLAWWRDVLLVQHGLEADVVHRDRLASLRRVAADVRPADTASVLRAVETAIRHLAASVNAHLVASVLVMELPK